MTDLTRGFRSLASYIPGISNRFFHFFNPWASLSVFFCIIRDIQGRRNGGSEQSMRWSETGFLLQNLPQNVPGQMQHQEGTLEFSGLFLMNSLTIKIICAYPSGSSVTSCAKGIHSTSASLFPCCLWQCSHLLNKLNASAILKNNQRNVSLQPAKVVPSAHKLWKW